MSIVVYRNTDRVTLKIHDVTFSVKPLTYKEKADITSTISLDGGMQTEDTMSSVQKIMKYSVKEVKGINYPDGSPLKLKFDDKNHLEEDSIDELLNMEITTDLTTALYSFMQGVPKKIVGIDGKKMDHVKILPFNGMPKKK